MVNVVSFCISLNEHSFPQVQCQMMVTGVTTCDFIIWTTKDLFVQRINYDKDFGSVLRTEMNIFFKKYLMPELLGKVFSRSGKGKN